MWVIKNWSDRTYYTGERFKWTEDIEGARTYASESRAEVLLDEVEEEARQARRINESKSEPERYVGENVPAEGDTVEPIPVTLKEKFPNEHTREPKPGDIALCGIQALGLVTSDGRETVEYEDGETAEAYTGIHLESRPKKGIERGDRWSSREPYIVTTVEGIKDYALANLIMKSNNGS